MPGIPNDTALEEKLGGLQETEPTASNKLHQHLKTPAFMNKRTEKNIFAQMFCTKKCHVLVLNSLTGGGGVRMTGNLYTLSR